MLVICLEKAMAAKAITADLAVIHASPSGEFVSRLINDVKLVREAIVRITNSIIRDLLTIIVMVTMMFWFDWVLALTVMVIYPLAIGPVAVIGRRQNEQSLLQEDLGRALSVLSETIQASRIVRAYRLEEHEVARTSAESLLGRTLKMMLGKMKIDPILECLGGIAIALAISISVWRLSTGALVASDIAGLTAFLVLVILARSTLSHSRHSPPLSGFSLFLIENQRLSRRNHPCLFCRLRGIFLLRRLVLPTRINRYCTILILKPSQTR